MAELNFDEILNKIAKNPDVLSKISKISESTKEGDNSSRLSEMIEAISPIFSESNKESISENAEIESISAEKTDTPLEKTQNFGKSTNSALPLPVTKLTEQIRNNSPLLCALKPYLSQGRRELIDNVLKMAQVADLMRLIK